MTFHCDHHYNDPNCDHDLDAYRRRNITAAPKNQPCFCCGLPAQTIISNDDDPPEGYRETEIALCGGCLARLYTTHLRQVLGMHPQLFQ